MTEFKWTDNNYFQMELKRNYSLEFFFFSGRHLNNNIINTLTILLRMFDQQQKKLKIGILDEGCTNEVIKRFFNNSIISILSKNGEIKGFSTHYMISEDPLVIHLGLVYSAKGNKINWILPSECLRLTTIYRHVKHSFFVTNLSKHPWIIANFSKFSACSWPNPFKPTRKKLKIYDYIAKCFNNEYLQKIRKKEDNEFLFNMDTFTCIEKGYSAIENDFSKLKKFGNKRIDRNVQKLLSYQKHEKLFQIGKVTWFSHIKMRIILLQTKVINCCKLNNHSEIQNKYIIKNSILHELLKSN